VYVFGSARGNRRRRREPALERSRKENAQDRDRQLD
jgi:hypothetical protein